MPIAYGLILLWLHSLHIDNVGERHERDGTGQYDDAHRVAANTGKRLYAHFMHYYWHVRVMHTYARHTDDDGMLWDMILGPTSERAQSVRCFIPLNWQSDTGTAPQACWRHRRAAAAANGIPPLRIIGLHCGLCVVGSAHTTCISSPLARHSLASRRQCERLRRVLT